MKKELAVLKSSIGNTLPAAQFRWIALMVLILTTAVLITRVRANDACQPVHGTINSLFTTQNCTSPVGLSTTGDITGSGRLDGSTTFVAEAIAPSAGLSPIELAANLSYSGQLTIVTSRGTLVTHDLGVLDAAHKSFTEMERLAAGTGMFANTGSTVFFIAGSIVANGQGFQGRLSGTICAAGD
jgi:hypothetical protein